MTNTKHNKVAIKSEERKIVNALANAMKIKSDALCFCGAGKTYGKCCGQASGSNLVRMENEFESAVKYRDSQRGTINTIPLGIWNRFQEKSIARLPCLYPGCSLKPVSCHLIPENILRASFGSHCLDYKINDESEQSAFVKTGKKEAGAVPVFCNLHDNNLYRDIDTLQIDFSSPKQQFLLAFKAIAFSLRKTQISLGIDSQVEVYKPFLMLNSKNAPVPGSNVTIDINHLHEQYIRFCTAHAVFQNTVKALKSEDWSFFSYLRHSIPYDEGIFYAGFINPPHDLENKRINRPDTPINMTCNIFTKNSTLHAIFACPGNESKEAYEPILEQLKNTDNKTFVIVLNNILTMSPDNLLLPENFPIDSSIIVKIEELNKHARNCINSTNSEVFDLKDASTTVTFVSMGNYQK